MIPTLQDVMDIGNNMLWMAFIVSLPMLLTALVVGVAISLVQTVTGIQEMTITFVPKLFAVLLASAAALPWALAMMMDYTKELWGMMAAS